MSGWLACWWSDKLAGWLAGWLASARASHAHTLANDAFVVCHLVFGPIWGILGDFGGSGGSGGFGGWKVSLWRRVSGPHRLSIIVGSAQYKHRRSTGNRRICNTLTSAHHRSIVWATKHMVLVETHNRNLFFGTFHKICELQRQ